MLQRLYGSRSRVSNTLVGVESNGTKESVMLLAAHIPEFFPSLALFEKMRLADVFVLLDGDRFEPGGPHHRALIKTPDGSRWLSVPVANRSRREALHEKRLDISTELSYRWGARALLTLRLAYHEAPYFNLYRNSLAAIVNAPWRNLSDLNIASIEFCREALGIRTPILRSSQLDVRGAGDGTATLCRAVGADSFMCDGADVSAALGRAGLSAFRFAFAHPRYVQFPRPDHFTEGLSVLDLLLNCGPQSNLVLGKARVLETAA